MRPKMSTIATSDGAFHNGNPSTGELGTIVTADWLNAVQSSVINLQDELLSVLGAASIATDPEVKTQILDAINKLCKSSSGNKVLLATILNGALTITIPAGTVLPFRSQILNDGSIINILTENPLTLTVPSGATLGSASAASASYAVVALYNAGAPVLGIVNLNGGVDLSEQGLMSSSAIGVSSTSISTVYSSSDVTSSPYYVLGVLQATEPTAGVWSTVPTNVLGRGSNLVSSLGSIGYGQTWKNVLGSRVAGVTYYNTTGRPIMVNAAASVVYTNDALKLTVNGVPIIGSSAASSNPSTYVSAIVPPGGSYVLSASNNGVNGINVLFNFVELR